MTGNALFWRATNGRLRGLNWSQKERKSQLARKVRNIEARTGKPKSKSCSGV